MAYRVKLIETILNNGEAGHIIRIKQGTRTFITPIDRLDFGANRFLTLATVSTRLREFIKNRDFEIGPHMYHPGEMRYIGEVLDIKFTFAVHFVGFGSFRESVIFVAGLQ